MSEAHQSPASGGKQHGEAPGVPYSENHPRSYRKPLSTFWWLGQWSFFTFMLREISSVFVAFFVVMTLLQIRALSQGREAYANFQVCLQSPVLLALHVLSFCFVLFHTITWFNLTPRAMAVRVRGKRIPDFLVTAPNYVAWLVISGILAWLLLRG